MKHTELPWNVEKHDGVIDEPWHTIVKGAIDVTHNKQPHEIASDKYSALSQEENQANAAFIVRACNSHYQLLEALEKLACLGNGDFYGNSEGNIIAQEAIKAAEEEQ